MGQLFERPIQAAFVLLLLALVLRVADIFVLRLDEHWGETLLSKALAFLLVLAYLRVLHRRVAEIGFHGRHLADSAAIAVTVTVLTLALGYGAEWIYLTSRGQQPTLLFKAHEQPLASSLASLGGVWLGLWLVFGNVVNSSMEEGMFRGVMLTHFRTRFSPWQANFLQALLFGLWHFVWPLKMFLQGRVTAATALGVGLSYVVASGIIGLLYGYMFLRTGNLWAPWIAHTLHNSTFNLVHTATPGGLDAGIMVRGAVMSVAFLLSLLLVRWMADRFRTTPMAPWAIRM
jgi:membrane protease YdiL (CAAX protease family)